MIAISMSFLAGRFHATPWERHVNESGIEYPPSSWRFLRALVATFYRARPDDMTEEQLTRILTTLSTPPSFHLPRASIGHTRHYDIANKSK
ncbi:MAG: type I-U CRISPR-associated protein Csb2, partial [Acidobacteriota bacterium]|nr:type I-U CRISPR-associated protein Csb2 [Acidobacteriota bacterium]